MIVMLMCAVAVMPPVPLQGEWVAVSIEQRGAAEPDDRVKATMLTLSVEGDKFTISTATGKSRSGRFRLDESATPHAIDLEREATGDEKSPPLLGIYELKGDRLRLAVDEGKRPRAFKSEGKDGAAVFLFERARRKR